jgi:hypothetical protein
VRQQSVQFAGTCCKQFQISNFTLCVNVCEMQNRLVSKMQIIAVFVLVPPRGMGLAGSDNR